MCKTKTLLHVVGCDYNSLGIRLSVRSQINKMSGQTSLTLEAENLTSCSCKYVLKKLFSFLNLHTLMHGRSLPFNPHLPADGSLAGDDVTLAVVLAEVSLQVADALTRQAVHAEVAGVADALRLPRPLVHLTLGVLVTRLELTGVSLVAWERKNQPK